MPTFPIALNDELLRKWRSSLNDEVIKSPCTPIPPMPTETLIQRQMNSLKEHAMKFPGKLAVIEAFNQDRALTYQQLHDRALSFAAFLVSLGVKIGDRVTVGLPNCIEFPVVHLGAWAAGASVVGQSSAFKLYESIYQLKDCSASVVVVPEHSLDTILEAAKECPKIQNIICVRSSTERQLPEGVVDFDDALRHEPLQELAPVTLDSECIVYYSSGTTGQPKGVVHTHRTFHCAVDLGQSHWEHEIYPVLGAQNVDWIKENQILFGACYHIFGFGQLNRFLLIGSPIVLIKAFDGKVFLDVIKTFKPRCLSISPPIFAFLAKDPRRKIAQLSSVQLIMCATAPLSKELKAEFLDRHPTVKYIAQAYGMTETGAATHLPLLLKEGLCPAAGILTSYFEQKIVDPCSLKVCKQGESGEVWVRGAPVTIGYLNRPEETKELIDEEGWLHTGDIGHIDERGLLFIVDRMKELIKVAYKTQTLQVAPAQIEGVLAAHNKIRDAAVVGIDNRTAGQLIRAFVVRANDTLTVEEVEDFVADKLAEFKRITGGVYFVDEIPRSPTGKILRQELREMRVV